jgi:hypothetical protein
MNSLEKSHIYCVHQQNKQMNRVPGLGQKRNAGLTYSNLAVISFKTVSLGMYTLIPSFFSHFKSTVKVISITAVEYHLRFTFECQTVSKRLLFSFIFNLGNKAKSQGAKSSE